MRPPTPNQLAAEGEIALCPKCEDALERDGDDWVCRSCKWMYLRPEDREPREEELDRMRERSLARRDG